MDFFERQDVARRTTLLLIALYIVGLLALVVSLVAVYWVIAITLLNLVVFSETFLLGLIAVVVITIAIIGLSTLYRVVSLRGGGSVVAEGLNGRLVDPGTRDLHERRAINVVEEMAIASGTAPPPLYILDHEETINAFAAGNSTEDAVIGLTKGAINHLSRDELQGVVAHEFSHIVNADTRINMRLMGLTFGLIVLVIIGFLALRVGFIMSISGGGRSRGGGKDNQGGAAIALAVLAMGGALVVIGSLGRLFAELIRAAVSRQREYLADASAVQFTRNPEGIGRALQRIGAESKEAREAGNKKQKDKRDKRAKKQDYTEVSHMLFSSAFMTHPPVERRIERIDASILETALPTVAPVTREQARTQPAGRSAGFDFSPEGLTGGLTGGLLAATVLGQAGQASTEHVAYAHNLLEHLPVLLLDAIHQPYSARAVIYGLLLERSPKLRGLQLDSLAKTATPDAYEATLKVAEYLDKIDPTSRLPLVEVAITSLRRMTLDQYKVFRSNVQTLIKADAKISLSEWLLQRIVIRNLDNLHGLTEKSARRPHQLKKLREECILLLSEIARAGYPTEAEIAAAFQKGMQVLNMTAQPILESQTNFAQLDEYLDILDHLKPGDKRLFLQACAATIEADNVVTAEQAEFYRAIAQSIHCPVPPLLPVNEPASPKPEETKE